LLLLSPFVILPVGERSLDVVLLPFLGAAAEQNDEALAVLDEIDPVAGAEIRS
jgi:hypothetical protein